MLNRKRDIISPKEEIRKRNRRIKEEIWEEINKGDTNPEGTMKEWNRWRMN